MATGIADNSTGKAVLEDLRRLDGLARVLHLVLVKAMIRKKNETKGMSD